MYGKKLIVATALLAAASMAMAGGPIVEPAPNWAGAYVGLTLGGAWGHVNDVFDGGDTTLFGGIQPAVFSPFGPGLFYSFTQKFSGVIGGVQLGTNWQWGSWVAGLESEFDGVNWNTTTTNPFALVATGVLGTTTTYQTKMNWLYSFTPRFGFAFDNWLLFAKIGLAITQIKSNLYSNTDVGGPFVFNQKQDSVGLDAGAGVNYLMGNWVLGVVYDYFNFRNTGFGGFKNPDDTWPVAYSLNNLKANAVKATVDYKFNA